MRRLLGFLAASKHVGNVEDAYHFVVGLEGYKTLAAASPRQGLVVACTTPAILLSGKVCAGLTCPYFPQAQGEGKRETECREGRHDPWGVEEGGGGVACAERLTLSRS